MQGTPEATPAPSRIVLAHSSGSKSHGVWKGLEGEPMTVHLREGDARGGRGTRGHAQSTQRARAESWTAERGLATLVGVVPCAGACAAAPGRWETREPTARSRGAHMHSEREAIRAAPTSKKIIGHVEVTQPERSVHATRPAHIVPQ